MKVPTGWSVAALGNVCRITSGGTPKTSVAANWHGEIPWITPLDLSRDRSRYVSAGQRSLSAAGLASSSAKLFPAGSVIVSSRAPIGYVAIAAREMSTNQGCKTATPPREIDPEYLYYFMVNAGRDLESRASGTTFKEISGRAFSATQLFWPSLASQRRIVDLLHDHLSRIDAATLLVANARTRAEVLVQRQLDLLMSGELRPLAELAEIQGGIQKQQKRVPNKHAYPFLRVANVTKDGLDLADVHRIELFEGELDRLRLRRGDLLVVEGNGSPTQIGRAALWDGSIEDCVHQNHLIRVRPRAGLEPAYLEAAWNSPRARRALTDLASSSSGLYTLSVSKLKQVSILVPPIAQQRAVVADLEAMRTAQRRLDVGLAAIEARARTLRRAVLAAAFAGRLTGRETDAEIILEVAATGVDA